MKSDLLLKGEKYLINNYARAEVNFVDGEKAYLIDDQGKRYDDFLSGIGVNSLGYSNSYFIEAIRDQVNKVCHTSNSFWIENQIELAELLCQNSFADRCLFQNSGAEANEAAIKLARKYYYLKGKKDKYKVINMSSSFHGRTLATLSITDKKAYSEGYGPLPQGFEKADFNDINSLKDRIDENTAAVILEPIQGESGVHPADKDFLKEVRELTRERDVLLIFDEVQCGMGRTGKLFCYENYGVEPDIMTLAKALGNGVPIGALLTREEIGETFTPGSHGTTFGGNHLSTRAGLAVMHEMIEEGLIDRAAEMGDYLISQLNDLKERNPKIKDIRGMGLMVGIDIEGSATKIYRDFLKEGIIINAPRENTIRLLPPFVIEKDQIDRLIKALDQAL